MAKEVSDVIVTNIENQFSFSEYLEASLLFETSLFENDNKMFPQRIFDTTIQAYNNLDAISLKQELTIVYRREDFRNVSGATHILQF